MGAPVAIGMIVVVAAGLTLGPAVVFMGSRFGLFEKKGQARGRLWRRVGTAVVRWPAPIFAVSAAVVLVGMVALPGFKPSYNDRHYLPESAPSNIGYAAADRHFSEARMNPDLLMIEADHDMRNPADMLVLDKVAKNEIRTVGIAMIQDITRPLGIPIQHSSIPFQNSIQSQTTMQNMDFLKDRMKDILKMADEMQIMIDVTERQAKVTHDLASAALDSAKTTQETSEITDTLRDHIADFEDFYRPIRSYFYWEKHCYDIPVCISFRSLFDSIDGFDQLAEKFHDLSGDITRTAQASHELELLIPIMLETLKTTHGLTLTMYQTFQAMINQMEAMSNTSIVMGQSFDKSQNDDFFYLPPEAFTNPEFIRGVKMFFSPDGKSVRFFITHQGDPMTPEGIDRVSAERTAAQEALKQSSLSDAKVYLGGTAATFRDMADGEKYDLMIAVVSALTLIFMIMLMLTRSVVAALVIVGTASSSIAASVRAVGADLAGPVRHAPALDRRGAVGDHPVGRRLRLQPAAGLAVQRRNTRRAQDRIHPVDGRHRCGGDVGGSGVRLHDGGDAGQRPDRAGPVRLDGLHRPAARHPGGAHAVHAVAGHHARPLVLVAAGGPSPRRPRQAEGSAGSRRGSQHRAAGRAEVVTTTVVVVGQFHAHSERARADV